MRKGILVAAMAAAALGGCATLPLSYVLNSNLASDFWIAKIVE